MIQYKPYGINKFGIPREWPKEVRIVDDGEALADGFIKITIEEYRKLLDRLAKKKDKWNSREKGAIKKRICIQNIINYVRSLL